MLRRIRDFTSSGRGATRIEYILLSAAASVAVVDFLLYIDVSIMGDIGPATLRRG